MVNEDGDIGALKDRTVKAGDARLLVSIHHDSVQPHYLETWEFEGEDRHYSDRFSGYALFVSRDNLFPAESLRCASTIGAALQARGYPPSYYHAEPIPGENRPRPCQNRQSTSGRSSSALFCVTEIATPIAPVF
jgi:N-acetylmuramoyl-L-alanine amidase